MAVYCTCGGGHATFGACMRAKNIRVGYCRSAAGLDRSEMKSTAKELDAYESARRQGVQPASTRLHDTSAAMEISNDWGTAFDAGSPVVSLD